MKKMICENREFLIDSKADVSITLKQKTDNVQVFRLYVNSQTPVGNVEIIIPFAMKGILSTYAPTNAFKRNRMVQQF